MVDLKKWQDSVTELKEIDVEMPGYDVSALKEKGTSNPVWIHFGGGNLFRGFHAEVAHKLANQGLLDSGVVVLETFDDEVIERVYHSFNNDILQVVMHADGKLEKRLLSSVAASYYCNPTDIESFEKIGKYFENPNLQFSTFTITEKGYILRDANNQFFPVIKEDIEKGPANVKHTMSIVTALLYKRFLAGQFPIAMVSTDNFSQNGKRFQESVLTIANEWVTRGLVDKDFIAYLTNPNKVAFPWSMIDRITPNPSENVKKSLETIGFSEMDIIHTSKHTNVAPFTNTEVVHYLVVEDSFPNGRPALEKAGVILADRTTVDKADVMKVTTCLNPLHTAMSVVGCLLGYTSISDEMKDEDIVGFIKSIGYHEGLPVVENPGIIDPKQFIDEVIEKRLPNPNIPDTPQRIASDTSQKVAIRFGETIKKYQEIEDRNPSDLVFIPLAIAAWLRYLLAIDDLGNQFTPSPDPMLAELQTKLSTIQLGEQDKLKVHQVVVDILSNQLIFGSDLYQAGLGEKIEAMYIEMLAGTGAVRKTLHQYVTEFGGK